jgi:transposase-like protein
MAESQSMTSAGVVAKALIEEHSDFLRDAVAMVAAQLMEAEIARQIGAGKGEVSEGRSTHRNGYRQRPWATRVGEIELAVPRKRSGESYFPSFLEPRKRSEKALLGVVMEAYVNGVSTRKVDHLVSELGIQMSKDQVSRICRELDGQVEAFRTRPLEGAYPYLWLDAKHLKVRDSGHVHSKALMVAFAVHESGRREVIGIEIAESEPKPAGPPSCASCAPAAWAGSGLPSLTITSASRPRSPRCSAALGSAARCTSSATCTATARRGSEIWSPRHCERSSTPRISPTRASDRRR